ncbi:hypothetical protein [Fusobacterium nucleatum]|uniref:hypothetical protein n=1 Tax=Fusobacterium nucleatum TaxID=851 RepID=UPI001EEEAFB6|nr:hypothetical protein [Fusobacterium nucleatum]
MEKNFKNLFDERKKLSKELDKTYIDMIENINNRVKELDDLEKVLQEDFLKACAMDVAGETVRTFFDTGDYNITADQLYDRIVNFSYEDKNDPLSNTLEVNKKNIYNLENSKESQENLKKEIGEPEKRIVIDENGKERKEYEDKDMIQKGKNKYRKDYDEIGNAKKIDVDHTQALAQAKAHVKYLKEGGEKAIKEFYNSEDNFQMLGRTANQCKGDAKVFLKDENGKVKPGVKRKIKEGIKKSQDKEGEVTYKNIDKTKVAKDAGKETVKQVGKMISGQLIYYLVPPMIYEIKENIKNKNNEDSTLENLKNSAEKIIEYASSKIGKILANIFPNGIKKFLKNFFDIIIEIVKGALKKILKIAKQLLITVVDAIKILFDSSKSFLKKMDAILQLVAGIFVNIAIGILGEYIQKQFMIPEMFWFPLEMIIRIILSNFIILLLKKLDLFGVNRKIKIEKVRMIFEEEREKTDLELQEKLDNVNYNNQQIFEELNLELKGIQKSIQENNMFNISIKMM